MYFVLYYWDVLKCSLCVNMKSKRNKGRLMQVSISEAHKLTGVARSTIYRDIENGTLSVTTGARKKKTIMVSELQRVYGDIKTPKNEDKKELSSDVVIVSNSSNKSGVSQTDQIAVLQERIEALKEKVSDADSIIEDYKQERNKGREIYQEQIDTLKDALNKAQEGQNKLTLLLDHKSKETGAGNWEKSFKALEARFANQEKAEKDREEREEKILRQNKILRNELKEERNKGFFKKLFG